MDATQVQHKKKPVNVRFPAPAKAALERMAESDGMSATAWLVLAVKREAQRRGIMGKDGMVKQ